MTKRFQIENTKSGVILGEYEAGDEASALDALARDAGYADYAEASAVSPAHNGEIVVTELS